MFTPKSLATASNPFAEVAAVIHEAPLDQCPALMGQLEALKASLWLRMSSGMATRQSTQPDRLLTAEEVAERLNVKLGFIYRNARTYPFTIRQGRYVRFSEVGLERYLRQRQGR